MNTQIANKIELVRNSFPSIFSKDDVLRLLEDLSNETASVEQQQPAQTTDSSIFDKIFSDENVEKLANLIYDSLDSSGRDIIDDYDLSISGREVEIDSVDFNNYEIKSCIESAVRDFQDNIEEEFVVAS